MARRFRESLYRIATGNHNNLNKKNGALYLNTMFYHISEEAEEEEVLPQEWYGEAFTKIRRLSRSLENVDMVNGRLVDIDSGSTIRDESVENRMCTYKSLVRGYLGSTSVQKTIRRNSENFLNCKGVGRDCEALFTPFSKPSERKPLVVDSLTKISNTLNVTAQQRKVVRQTVCHQVTQQRILIGALENILTGLKCDLDSTAVQCSSKCRHMSKQIVHNCLKFLTENAVSFDPEYTPWIRLAPAKKADSSNSRKWEDVLQMFNDLIEYLASETRFQVHVDKLKVMKEGLAQIKDLLVGSGIGYKEARYQEYLVQKKLNKTLGHSSRCLFTLLLCYLYESTMDFEVDICGGMYQSGPDKFCLYLGKILTSGDEKMGQLGVRQLDKALRLFKFIWEIAGMKGCLEIQGHLFCVGADTRLLHFRGNIFILHGMGD